MNWWQRLISDPLFCRRCGARLERDESDNFDTRTGDRRPLPFAACPTLHVTLYPGGGYSIRGGFPEHTVIFHEPRWPAAPGAPEEPPE